MKTRIFALCAIGLAAAITIGSAEASAQAKSQKRIPVRKEEPKEEPKVDTIRIRVVDTVTVRSRPDTIVRTVTLPVVHDTVMQMLPKHRLPGWYGGIGGGVAVPMNSWRNSTKDGGTIQGMVGWYPKDGAFGLRLDALGNFLNHRASDCFVCNDPKFFESNLDVTLRFPLDRTSWLNPTIYFLGGGGIDHFSDFIPYVNTDGKIVTAGSNTFLGIQSSVPPFNVVLVRSTDDNSDWFWNYNFGAGLDWRSFGLTWYVESKYTTINTHGGNSHYWPITIGLKFF
jgi:hypothetical protein